jgi:hypothetical protein
VLVLARPGGNVLGGVSDWGDNIAVDNEGCDEGCEVAERSCASSLADKLVGTGTTRSGGAEDGPGTGPPPSEE